MQIRTNAGNAAIAKSGDAAANFAQTARQQGT